ncbi:NAD-dependent formate dehydrogenase gamma subunit [Marinobacterium lacunae]|uniref:NADH-quinone oxidoreductase subunit E n=1 Tax=Marinobacterium lacunae TaxID=1232683 RepID=A0A081FZ31_9GAMM|nr:formate dehydrogenase subunit gamma [Marinobacterium lacunae]KEA63786.1 NAD-dependent formate dehydrogenase gamma subunit [Marinobacterium lacunae]
MSTPGSASWEPTVAQAIIDELKSKPGALLPILHAIQDRFTYIPDDAVSLIAPALKLSRAEVHGVISFYHHFRTREPGRHVVEICRAEACQAQGARALEAHAKAALGVDYHQTTADRTVTLEPVYCLGNCACGPSVRVGDEIHAGVDAQRFDELVDALKTDRLEVQ